MTPSWRRSKAGANYWPATWRCATRRWACRELNYAVQMTIDRIIFLRICEDRGIEREEPAERTCWKARKSMSA